MMLKEDGIGQAPGSKMNKAVMSITTDGFYLVKVSEGKLPQPCNCEWFKQKGLCSHVLAVSFQLGSLERVISRWTPNITRQLEESMPYGAGRKENEKGKKNTGKGTQTSDPLKGFRRDFH